MSHLTMVGAALLAASVTVSGPGSLTAQDPAAVGDGPRIPYTPEASAAGVDAFVTAFNEGDSAALRSSFSPSAKAFTYDKDDTFSAIDWLPNPWGYHQLQAGLLEFHEGRWRVTPGRSASISLLGRIVSQSHVVQRERISYVGREGRRSTLTQLVHYQMRSGRIHRLWIFPYEELDVPEVLEPRYAEGSGPVIWFDVGHHNQDEPNDSYFRFAELLRRDGYRVRTWEANFAPGALDTLETLVIANAMPEATGAPGQPARSSAFSVAEERALEDWVRAGGSLLLIADHRPMAGAAARLAERFGADFRDGTARDTAAEPGGDLFLRFEGTLRPHPITDGTSPRLKIDSVATYLGQAFRVDEGLRPLLVFPGSFVLTEPDPEGGSPRRTPVEGWSQGAVGEVDAGRVALFGEAWMFRNFSLGQNAALVRNLMYWLVSGS